MYVFFVATCVALAKAGLEVDPLHTSVHLAGTTSDHVYIR